MHRLSSLLFSSPASLRFIKMAFSLSALLVGSLISAISAQVSCGLGSMEPVAPQTITFVLPAIKSTAAITTTVVETNTTTTTATVTTSSPYPFLDDLMQFPSLLPLPDDIDVYHAYQKIAASMDNNTIAWWVRRALFCHP